MFSIILNSIFIATFGMLPVVGPLGCVALSLGGVL